jgi:hypothetical protein
MVAASPVCGSPVTLLITGMRGAWKGVASSQGLTLVHFAAVHKHILWDTLGA